MVTETLRSLHRNGLNYISRNSRLLIGRLEDENQSTEVWLAKTLPSDYAGESSGTKGWCLYKSAEGWELLKNVSELHPALQAHLVDENSEDFFSKSKEDKLRFLTERYDDVVRGRYKYSEIEGGELKAVPGGGMFPRHGVGDATEVEGQTQGRKRKRDSDPSADSVTSVDSVLHKKAKLCPDYFNGNNHDDDEELPPHVKVEETKVDAMDHTPTVLEPANPHLQQHQAAQSQPHDQTSTSLATLGIAREINPANQDVALAFKKALLARIDEWALSAAGLKHGLTEPAGELCVAFKPGEILAASRKILQFMYTYCGQLENVKAALQTSLMNAKALGVSVDIVQTHESLVRKYQEKENELRSVVEEMKRRAEALQNESRLS